MLRLYRLSTSMQGQPQRSWAFPSTGGTSPLRWAAMLLACHLLLPTPLSAQSPSTELTPIAEIQGAGPASTFDEQEVTTWGLVTGVTSDGFYLQDPLGDGDATTSDGLFVYTYNPPTVTVGECVRASGEIVEYYAKTELNWLTAVTPSSECGAPTVAAAPLPVVRPGDDPGALLEALEGMVVRLDRMTGVVHGPTKLFSGGEQELAILPTQWQRYFGPVHLFQEQPQSSALLFLSNRLGATIPSAQWGDSVQIDAQGLVGVLDYNFGKYQLLPLPDQAISATSVERPPLELPPLAGDEYGLCTFNLHGFGRGTAQFPSDDAYALALQARARMIAEQLGSCTVIALQETGSPDDAAALAEALTLDHNLSYQALSVAGPSSYEPEFSLTNSMLVDSTRVTVERFDSIIGCAEQDYDIVAPGACPLDEYPVFDRPPLMAKLLITGTLQSPWQKSTSVWVISNHWKSKSGDEVANAKLRAAQATAVADQVRSILSSDLSAQVVVMGDLNDFYEGAAVSTLQSMTGLFHAYAWLPPLDRYTYIFNGAAQVLDHVLITANMAPQVALVRILHLNADFPTGESPLAHSDHDPVVLHLRPSGTAMAAGTLQWGQIAIEARADDGTPLAQTLTDAQGEYRLWGLTPAQTVTLQLHAPEWIVLETLTTTVETTAGMTLVTTPHARHVSAMTGAWLALNTSWLTDLRLADLLKP